MMHYWLNVDKGDSAAVIAEDADIFAAKEALQNFRSQSTDPVLIIDLFGNVYTEDKFHTLEA